MLSYVCGGSSIVAILILLSLIPHNFDDDLTQSRLSKFSAATADFYQSVVEQVVKNLEPNPKTDDEPRAESKIAEINEDETNHESLNSPNPQTLFTSR